jgi:hypothetical protein
MFWTTERRLLPQSRFVRNAWVLGESQGAPVSVDMNRARKVFLQDLSNRYRAKRRALQDEADVACWLIDRDIDDELQQLKAIDPQQIHKAAQAATTPDQLEQLIPDILKE